MLEEALPVAAGVAVALLPCMAFGGLAAARGFMILGGGECSWKPCLLLLLYCLSGARCCCGAGDWC